MFSLRVLFSTVAVVAVFLAAAVITTRMPNQLATVPLGIVLLFTCLFGCFAVLMAWLNPAPRRTFWIGCVTVLFVFFLGSFSKQASYVQNVATVAVKQLMPVSSLRGASASGGRVLPQRVAPSKLGTRPKPASFAQLSTSQTSVNWAGAGYSPRHDTVARILSSMLVVLLAIFAGIFAQWYDNKLRQARG